MLSVRHEEQYYTVVILQSSVFGQAFQFRGRDLIVREEHENIMSNSCKENSQKS